MHQKITEAPETELVHQKETEGKNTMTEEILERARTLETRELLTGKLLRQLVARYQMAWHEEDEEKLEEAIDGLWNSRKTRAEHPEGSFDNSGRWYPSNEEECRCCRHVRSPSRNWPYSLIKHCRSRAHLTRLAEESPDHFESLTGYKRQEYIPLEALMLELAPLPTT